MGLFRDEVVQHRSSSLDGAVTLFTPISWQFLCLFLFVLTLVMFSLLLAVGYARSETVAGAILPSGGIVRVVAPRSGRVEAVMIKEGDFVRRGAALLRVGIEETGRSGAGTQASILSAIGRQQQSLSEQLISQHGAAAEEKAGYIAQLDGLRHDIEIIGSEVSTQEKLVQMAADDLTVAEKIALKGFISKRDIAGRQETLLSREQQLASLQETLSARRSSFQQAERAEAQSVAKASGAAAVLASAQAQLERDRASVSGEQGYLITAPLDGTVAAVNVQLGDAVELNESQIMLVPAREKLVARMYIPAKAAGFVRAGQKVQIELDAYPHDQFGTLLGYIKSVSTAPIFKNDKEGNSAPFYTSTAVFRMPKERFDQRNLVLLPGMTFTARVKGERRSLANWLFSPLLETTRR